MLVCVRREVDPFRPPLTFLLDYLLREFKDGKGRSYSSLNTIRSAISAVVTIDGNSAGRHLLVSRFMKAVFQMKPSFSRCHTTWDSELLLTYII